MPKILKYFDILLMNFEPKHQANQASNFDANKNVSLMAHGTSRIPVTILSSNKYI
jgi:hypothetical protein